MKARLVRDLIVLLACASPACWPEPVTIFGARFSIDSPSNDCFLAIYVAALTVCNC